MKKKLYLDDDCGDYVDGFEYLPKRKIQSV